MRVNSITSAPSLPLVVDIVEKSLLLIACVAVWWRVVPHMAGASAIIDTLVLTSEAVAVLFILLRRPTKTLSRNPRDWAFTAIGTFCPLLVAPSAAEPIAPIAVALFFTIAGFFLQISAKLALRRSFGLAPANRGVKIGGPYQLLRHPMYAGYLLTHIAFLTVHPSIWNLLVYSTCLVAQCFRILAEERILGEDAAYRDFAKSTRYRLIPFVF
ncbi:isoprenylcysteine carboxyl methyltransferase [Rhizobium sp. AC44/96]|uniref:methyltransferase family protein n=1 Tax=unclassified Rhizobium TaxID=2613769 RepID=UPI00080FBF81|nr:MULTISPECIES: isoprenylcysteine carboxylmethyltransferase family protein [unclassified Rhizobium]MDM9621762.1 isoprenylcysteine carboxylmethyltransferase family protein [Rhizobium sp. S96]OCJ04976.1 isoprenylcysteine carboxyl methyltransferase [Rhizobium sp. AC44/96]